MPLTMPEEILLLLLDDETGRPHGLPGPAAALALAGALIMELALAGRIDTDLDALVVVRRDGLGDPLLDETLARIAAGAPDRTSRWWIQELARQGTVLRTTLLERLVAAGILRRVRNRILWVFADHSYPKTQGRDDTLAVRARLRGVLLDEELPEPRDAMMIGLVRAAGLVPFLLLEQEARQSAARIEHVSGLEEVSRSLAAAVRDAVAALMRSGAEH